MSLFDRDKSAERLPVSVITGFLGSGKTTLLNKLLRHPGMANSAVVINEFGEIGLDHLLVEAVDGETVLMSSGCLCCTIRSDLEETLRRLVFRRERAEIPRFERILVETTGLADPAPIAQLLLNNPLVSHSLRLDAIVTTVDAVHGGGQLNAHEEALKQAAIADRLVLTKTDLAEASAVAALRRRLAALNPAAPVEAAVQGEIPPGKLFGAGLFDPARKTADVRRWLREEAYAGAHHHAHDVNRHDSRIRAFCLTFEDPLEWQKIALWLGRLRRGRGADLLRVKGVLNLRGEPGPVVVHGVQHIFHPPVALDDWPDADRRSRLVVIARDIEPGELEESWKEFNQIPSPSGGEG
jgi:G3E family GTPase